MKFSQKQHFAIISNMERNEVEYGIQSLPDSNSMKLCSIPVTFTNFHHTDTVKSKPLNHILNGSKGFLCGSAGLI